jgi:hypothetical protein
VENDAITHAKQIDAFFAIRLAIVDPFDRERITGRLGRLVERDPMITPVARGFVVVPSEAAVHKYTDYQ